MFESHREMACQQRLLPQQPANRTPTSRRWGSKTNIPPDFWKRLRKMRVRISDAASAGMQLLSRKPVMCYRTCESNTQAGDLRDGRDSSPVSPENPGKGKAVREGRKLRKTKDFRTGLGHLQLDSRLIRKSFSLLSDSLLL